MSIQNLLVSNDYKIFSETSSIGLPAPQVITSPLESPVTIRGNYLQNGSMNDVCLAFQGYNNNTTANDWYFELIPQTAGHSDLTLNSTTNANSFYISGASNHMAINNNTSDANCQLFVSEALKTNYIVNNGVNAFYTPITALTATATLTAATLLNGIFSGQFSSGATYTLDTAANIVAAIPGCQVGTTFTFLLNNLGANTATITIGTGGFLAVSTSTLAANAARTLWCRITNISTGTQGYNLYG
jgi:hypothetical protein